MKLDDAEITPIRVALNEGAQHAQEMQQHAMAILGFLKGVFKLFAWVISIPMEVFLHRGFGIRYLNPVSLVLGAVTLSWGTTLTSGSDDSATVTIGGALLVAYLVFALIHLVWASYVDRKGTRWHSRSAGIPWGFWKYLPVGDPGNIVRVYEPVLVGLIGGALIYNDIGYGIFLVVMAVTVWAKRWVEAWDLRGRVLDQIDEQIEAEMMADLVEEKRSPWETDGYVIPKVAVSAAKKLKSVSVEEAMANLDMTMAEVKPGSVSTPGKGPATDDHEAGFKGLPEKQ